MVTCTVPPAPEVGKMETCAAGVMDNDALLPLEKTAPVEVEPESETRYEVGRTTAIETGTVNVTRWVPPNSGWTALAWVVPDGPAPAFDGCSVTVTLAGGMLPLGKP